MGNGRIAGRLERPVQELGVLLAPLVEDRRIGPVHVCVYLALVVAGRQRAELFVVCREEVMRLAKIQGRTTYYRVMKDLAKWEYIEYRPGVGKGKSEVGLRL